jgi:MFS family permease
VKSFLVRCFPARWRDRYGSEFEAILEERPLGPFDVADILLAAIDAHLHLRGIEAASQRRRGFMMSLRLGGSAAILGGVLFLGGLVASSIDQTDDGGGPWTAFLFAGTAALLLALIGLSAFQARRHPRLIWAAFALPAIGMAMACIGIVGMAVAGDGPLVAGLSPWDIWVLGILGTVLGSALFAIATYRTRVLSQRAAALLATGSILLVAILVIAATRVWTAGTGDAGVVTTVLTFVGVLAFTGGWIALGWTALRLQEPTVTAAA